ncbi:MAG: glycosyltransferase family 4 protein [Acidobacteriota bacterium]
MSARARLSARARRITVFAGDLGPRAVGRWRGGVRLHGLIECLLALGHDVGVIGFGPAEGLGDLGSRVASVHVAPRRAAPAGLRDLLRAARASRGELLLAHKLRPLSFGVALLARRLSRRPLMLDLDDDEMRFAPTSSGWRALARAEGPWRQLEHPRYFRWLERRARSVDRLTAASTELARRFDGELLPTARDTDRLDPSRFDGRAERARLGLDPAQRLLLFAGAPRPYKGLEDLLHALEALPAEPPCRLLILGGSPYDDYHDHLMRGWPQRVVRRPAVAPAEVPAYLAAADLVVVPQRDTPITRCQLPLKLLDGMAMARPVLVTRVGDLPEIVGDAGFVAEPGDPDSLRRQLEAFLGDAEGARRRGEVGRQRALQRFSVKAVARRLEALLPPADAGG